MPDPMLRRHPTRWVPALGALLLLLAGCGTVSFTNRVAVSVADSSRQWGDEPLAVSVFDPLMGDTRDWARESLGTTAPGEPYRRDLPDTGTRWVGDSSPPRTVQVGIYLPEVDRTGYYAVTVEPVSGQTRSYDATYVSYDYSWETTTGRRPTGPPLPLTVTSLDNGNGWDLQLAVALP